MKPRTLHAIILLLAACVLCSCSPQPAAAPAAPQEIQNRITGSYSPLLLVHVWATWCPPCREEFPAVVELIRQFRDRGVEVILISADEPAEGPAVEAFLREQNSPVGSLITTELSQKFIETLSPNWGGALPASFFYDHNGKLLTEWEGMRTLEQYTETIETLLNQQKESTP